MFPSGPANAGDCVLEVPEPGERLLCALFPHLRGLHVERVEETAEAVVISACSRSSGAVCPSCGTWSSRVHSRYARCLADGAAGGRPVVICLSVRRLFCASAGCPAVTFAEQAEGLSARYLRRSMPLLGMLAQVALALAGRAGSRLAGALGIDVHPATLLRLVRALPDPEISAAPRVLGVDDFAFRKGHVYGTVLVDMSTGNAIDLLPDREAATLTAWLKAHPGAEIICRDRSGAYAEGARDGAPDAIQVADRWHLWHNLGECAQKTVAAHRGCLTGTGPAPETGSGPPPAAPAAAVPDGFHDVHGRPRRLVARTLDRHAGIHHLIAAGESQAAISRILDLDPATVAKYAGAATPAPLLTRATSRETALDPFKPYLHQRWNQGITDATVLHAELEAQGWKGSAQAVRRYIRPFRAMTAAPPPPPAVPKTRQITRWLLTRPGTLQPGEQAAITDLRARCPHLDALAGHITAFAQIMTRRTGSTDLDGWLASAETSDLPELRTLAAGMRRDQHAVTSGLTLPHSSGKVEGNVNKIKMIKRQMYGRATFPLLRKRVILHPR
jgi:transposase